MKLIRSSLLRLAASGLAIELSLALLARSGFPATAVGEAVAGLLATSLFYLIAWRTVLSEKPGTRGGLPLILLFAAAFRLTMAPTAPELSNDLYRYRWEGRVQLAGGSPWEARPDEPRWAALRDETYERLAGKDVRFGYGPLWLLVERGMASTGAGIRWWKLPAALCDLGVLAALMWLLRLHGLPRERLVLYAWCPLPVIEFWHAGHNDAAIVLCLALALYMAKSGRWAWSYALLAAAALVKFWPLLLVPLWLERSRNWRAALAMPAAAAPFVLWTGLPPPAVFGVLGGFLGGWRNNDSLFGAVLWLCGGNALCAVRVSFALIAGLAPVVALRRAWPLERATLIFIAGMLALSANVHPWYLTWFLPLMALEPWPALLVWTGLMPLAYMVLADFRARGVWDGSTGRRWWIYVPVAGVLLLQLLHRFRRRIGT